MIMRRTEYIPHLLLAITIAGTLFVISASMATAQTFVPLAPAPGGTRLGDLYGTNGSLADFFNKVFVAMIAVGAILGVLRLAFAGYLYMTTDAFHQKSHAKQVIGDVILGLLLLLSIWLILRQINPNLLDLNVFRNANKVQIVTPTRPAATNQAPANSLPAAPATAPGSTGTGSSGAGSSGGGGSGW